MKIFKILMELETVVCAENEKEAMREAIWAVTRDDEDNFDIVTVTEVRSKLDLPDRWAEDYMPWGTKNLDDKTIKEFLDEQ